jgi:hypothetical protein
MVGDGELDEALVQAGILLCNNDEVHLAAGAVENCVGK